MSTLENKTIARIYLLGVGMLIMQVVLGGVTRLTGSGLSITSWNVVTGFFPPMSEDAWLKEFDHYKETLQYQVLNVHFSLDDFKFIFFWEWFHRFWARLTFIVLVSSALYLWQKKYLSVKVLSDFGILILFGGLQGLVGWIMVKSGLTGDAIYVVPSKLSIHFVLAVLLIATVFLYALRYLHLEEKMSIQKDRRMFIFSGVLLWFTFLQIIFGCFMAGTHAAATASTFPTINGSWIPYPLIKETPISRWLQSGIIIHFFHRTTAYLLFLCIVIWTYFAIKKDLFLSKKTIAYLPLSLTVVQIGLGIGSVLYSPYIVPNSWRAFQWFAQLHQIVSILLVLSLVTVLYLFMFSTRKKDPPLPL